LFLNTSIRRLQFENVTLKWPVIGVGAVFSGEYGDFVGENDGEITLARRI